MLQIKVKIRYNKKIKVNYFHLVLRIPKIAKDSLPGQFFNIKVSDTCEPLLRRPLSIHRVKGTNIEFLYEVVGRATQILSQRRPGEYLDVIGPLGNGFNLTPNTYNLTPILVAGGIGVAPLLFLADKLAYSVERRAYRKNKKFKLSAKRYPLNALVLIGAKSTGQVLRKKEFKALGCEVKIATDDASEGFKGKVTELLKNILPLAISHKPLAIYACGPRPMLKEIIRISKKYNIPTQVSLEEHMACGIGACLGCVMNTKEGFKRVCKEGPVFNGDEIIWVGKEEVG